MVFNATFNNISVILWRSVLLRRNPENPEKNHRPVASHSQIWFIVFNATFNNISVISWRSVLLVMFNATFNNISAISWRSVLLVGRVPRENH